MTLDDPEARTDQDSLLARFVALDADDPQRPEIREALVVIHQPLVRSLASRYAGRGEPIDDLIQAGNEGLLKAVDRYDPAIANGVPLKGFAIPYVLGEIRRHFRDRTWAVHVPRGMQDLGRRVDASRDALGHSLGRSPTIDEIAADLGVRVDDVLEALDAAASYSTAPLEILNDSGEVSQVPGFDDAELARVLHRESLRPALRQLPERERRILQLRFIEQRTQEEIADDIGLTQSQVSRTLTRTLLQLRRTIGDDEPDG